MHWFGVHEMNLDFLYKGDYVQANYGDLDGIHDGFERIMNLPPQHSDNRWRVERVKAFAQTWFSSSLQERHLLDVGSGLGVFPWCMSIDGWIVTSLEPDPFAARHLFEKLGLATVQKDFMQFQTSLKFHAVTLNKVAEHVIDPVGMLKRVKDLLAPCGFSYIEVPDGESAAQSGPEREEFFVDHWHAFSAASLALAVTKVGLKLVSLERLREPSLKYTLCCIAVMH
jgi:hypothetical protein